MVVFNNTGMGVVGIGSFEHYGVPCAPREIGSCIAFVHSFISGLTVQEYEPRGKASQEIKALYKYIAKEMEV